MLELNLSGAEIVETRSEFALPSSKQLVLRHLIDRLDRASKDPKVAGLVAIVGDCKVGLAQLQVRWA